MNLKNIDLSNWGPVTVLLVLLVLGVAVAGVVTVIVAPDTLSFEQYLNDMEKFAIALGVLGVGRGIQAHGDAISRNLTEGFPTGSGNGKAEGYSVPSEADYLQAGVARPPQAPTSGIVTGEQGAL